MVSRGHNELKGLVKTTPNCTTYALKINLFGPYILCVKDSCNGISAIKKLTCGEHESPLFEPYHVQVTWYEFDRYNHFISL